MSSISTPYSRYGSYIQGRGDVGDLDARAAGLLFEPRDLAIRLVLLAAAPRQPVKLQCASSND